MRGLVEVAVLLALRNTATLLDSIVQHPSVGVLNVANRPKRKLQRRHAPLFGGGSTLLDQLGSIVCQTGVVPRKELFETYAAAVCIHEAFPETKRVADLAGGHGMLGWFLLALDPTRTVVCVDANMPKSADVLADAMVAHFPSLQRKWTYIQADLSCVEPDPSTVMVSVHACGSLTDALVGLAIDGKGAPLAVVPCCHSVGKGGYRPHARYSEIQDATVVAALVEKKGSSSIADVVDGIRCQTLQNAGYQVQQIMLPELFTKKNRLLLAKRVNSNTLSDSRPTKEASFFERKDERKSLCRIPLADTPESIAQCHALSGREQAHLRLRNSIPKHFSPRLNVSIWLSEKELSVEALERLANDCCGEQAVCTVSPHGQVDETASGKRSQTYQVVYSTPGKVMPREMAKQIHTVFREKLTSQLGLQVR